MQGAEGGMAASHVNGQTSNEGEVSQHQPHETELVYILDGSAPTDD